MSDVDAGSHGPADLSPPLDQRLLRGGVRIDLFHAAPEVPVRVGQTGHFVNAGHRPPPVFAPFRSVAKVDAEVPVRVFSGISGDFGKPGTRHHDGGGAHQSFFKALDGGLIGGVAHPGVVTVYNEELIRSLVAQSFGERSLVAGVAAERAGEKGRREMPDPPRKNLSKLHVPFYFLQPLPASVRKEHEARQPRDSRGDRLTVVRSPGEGCSWGCQDQINPPAGATTTCGSGPTPAGG